MRIIESSYQSLYDKFSADNWRMGVKKLESLLYNDKIYGLDEMLSKFNSEYDSFIKSADYCIECGSYGDFVVSNGFDTCIKCGVQYERKTVEDERRAFNEPEVKARKQNAPVPRHLVGSRTVISNKKSDYKGCKLNPVNAYLARTLIKTNSKLGNAFSSAKRETYASITKINSAFFSNLPAHVIRSAEKIFAESSKCRLIRGRSVPLVWVSSVYAAMHVDSIPTLLNFFADDIKELEISDTDINSTFNTMKEAGVFENIYYTLKPLIIPWTRITAPFNLHKSEKDLLYACHELLCEKSRMKITGKAPSSIIGAELYLLCDNYFSSKITQKKVAKVMCVTEVTVRNVGKIIKKDLDEIVSSVRL